MYCNNVTTKRHNNNAEMEWNIHATALVSKNTVLLEMAFVVKMAPKRVDWLTYGDADPGTGDSQADVISEGHVDAEDTSVIEELTEDQLALGSGCHSVADRLDWCDAVGIRYHRAHLTGQAVERRLDVNCRCAPSWKTLSALCDQEMRESCVYIAGLFISRTSSFYSMCWSCQNICKHFWSFLPPVIT